MRVALVYDRINKIGGAEVILTQLAGLYPEADWYTSVWDPTRAPFSKNWKVHTSWLNKLPLLRTHHEWLPWLMPFVFESFDFGGYDLVISVGSAEAKGIITRPPTYHLHYCLTPTRYLYSHTHEYLSNPLYRFIAKYLRRWDQIASTRPDKMIAISTQVKKRIQKYYNRASEIVFPPVDTEKFFTPSTFVPTYQNYFLTVARLVAYKNINLLIKVFNTTKQTLVIVGDGAQRANLTRLAGPTIHLVGAVEEAELIGYYQHCLAFVHAGEEDFGIAMCEAQASGKPVIAYAAGGALDIIQNPRVGILVPKQTPGAFAKELRKFDTMSFVSAECRDNASRFRLKVWQDKFKQRLKAL